MHAQQHRAKGEENGFHIEYFNAESLKLNA